MIMSTKEICKRGLSMTISLTLGNSALPPADRLVGDVEPGRQSGLSHAALPARLGNECAEFCCVHTIASRCRFVYKASIAPRARGRNRRAAGMTFLRVCTHSTICLPGFLRRGV